jgi:hypothetical protein
MSESQSVAPPVPPLPLQIRWLNRPELVVWAKSAVFQCSVWLHALKHTYVLAHLPYGLVCTFDQYSLTLINSVVHIRENCGERPARALSIHWPGQQGEIARAVDSRVQIYVFFAANGCVLLPGTQS